MHHPVHQLSFRGVLRDVSRYRCEPEEGLVREEAIHRRNVGAGSAMSVLCGVHRSGSRPVATLAPSEPWVNYDALIVLAQHGTPAQAINCMPFELLRAGVIDENCKAVRFEK